MGPFRDVEAALTEFSKKFKDKTGLQWQNRHQDSKSGKYTYIEKDYEQNDDDDESSGHKEEAAVKEDTKAGVREIRSKLPLPTQRLMELIFNQTYQNIVLENLGYNKDKLPLGKLGKPTIKKGFEHLQELAGLLQDSSIAEARHGMTFLEAIEEFTNRYYSTIPHMFGRNRPPIINNQIMLKQEIDMLDTLSDMEIAEHIMQNTDFKIRGSDEINLVDQHFKQLNLEELTPLDAKGKEYQMLKDYLINTSGHTHAINYHLQDVFRVERQGETDRFAKSDFSVLQHSNRRLLWHGSRTTNFGGILQQGLRIAPPEAPASGYAFGKGVYFADISTKSANYCVPSLSGGNGLLLLCEAELGSPMYEITHSDYEAGKAAKKQGCIATMGLGITVPQGWMDAGEIHGSLKGVQIPDISKQPCRQMIHPAAYLQYNEYICYDVAQVRLRYLLRVQMT